MILKPLAEVLWSIWGFFRYSDSEHYGDWVYHDCPDDVWHGGHLRYSPSTDRLQMLDVDGWCDPMSTAEMAGEVAKQQEAWMERVRAFIQQSPVEPRP